MNFYQELIDELGIKNELTCFQCNNLVKNPMQCFNCQKISCKKCHKKKCCENPFLKKCLFLKNMIENLHKIKKPKEENSNNININYDNLINEINYKTNEIQKKKKKLTEIDENLKEKINDLQSKVDSFNKKNIYDKNDIKKMLKEYESKNKISQIKFDLLKNENENENYLYNFNL